MYKSKYEVERKVKQVKFALNELNKFKNRAFIKNGVDDNSGCFPMEVRLVAFVTLTRSIFQYAHKEAQQNGTNQTLYDSFVNENKVITFFKDLRNSEIHSFSISSTTEIYAPSPIESFDSETNIALGKPVNIMFEELADIDSPKVGTSDDVKIQCRIIKRLEVTPELITRLRNESKQELINAIEEGEELFEGIELDGITDMFELCDIYYDSALKFVAFGISMRFIT